MTQLFSLAAVFLTVLQAGPSRQHERAGQPGLITEILQDAQKSNLAKFRSGSMSVTAKYHSASGDGIQLSDVLRARVVWNDRYSLCEFTVDNPDDPFQLIPGGGGSLATAKDKPFILLWGAEKIYFHIPINNSMYVLPNDDFYQKSFLPFDLAPKRNWSRFYGKLAKSWRPWSEVMGPSPIFEEIVQGLSMSPISPTRYKQTRNYKSGARQEMIFSLDHGGNALETSYEGEGVRTRNSYKWTRYEDSDIYFLEDCKLERIEGAEEFVYEYSVSDLKLGDRLSSNLSLASFYAMLPKTVTTHDEVAGGGGPTRGRPLSEGDLDRLVPTIQKGAFMKRGE